MVFWRWNGRQIKRTGIIDQCPNGLRFAVCHAVTTILSITKNQLYFMYLGTYKSRLTELWRFLEAGVGSKVTSRMIF